MPDVAVIFGGPSPEHDVSVLTGLQAARGSGRRTRVDPASLRALFWSKTGDWYEVDPGLEAEAFLEGVPRGAKKLQLVAGARRGVLRARGPARPGPGRRDRCRPGLLPRGPGRGRHPAGRPRPGRHPLRGADGGRRRPGHGQAGLRIGGGRGRAAHPAPGVCWPPRSEPPPFEGPYIVKPRFGGSSIGIDVVEDFATALARLAVNPHLRFGAVLEPYRPDLTDLQVAVRTWPELELSAVERPIRASGLGRHPRLPRQVRGRRGHGRGQP